jgi:BirA family biotin operon repressor/biotin-[acetyl-CoA-carboxylase] ligase
MGVQFTKQFGIGGHVVDFACRSLRLVIEVDGGQHAENCADDDRTREIDLFGYTVIRFWNNDVLGNTEGVLIRIAEAIAIARNEA